VIRRAALVNLDEYFDVASNGEEYARAGSIRI
jgi:hypothetical protein